MAKPVLFMLGAGAGIGGTVAAKFASEGYHSVLARRSNKEGLDRLVGEINESGGSASGMLLDATKPDTIEDAITHVEAEKGAIEVAVFNLGAQVGDRPLEDTTYKTFELGWRMAVFALFRLAKVLCPLMAERGGGTLLVTSATSSRRGNAGQHSHAAAMGGRRMLCQSLNAQYAPLGIHVAHIVVDGSVDAPDTLGRLFGEEAFAKYRESMMAEDNLILPVDLAETYFHLAQQPRNCWTHEIDVRGHKTLPWWNH